MSHPSWVCGLKHGFHVLPFHEITSHPSWVCGLKLLYYAKGLVRRYVTPFVGVWIETRQEEDELLSTYSHTLRGCVD